MSWLKGDAEVREINPVHDSRLPIFNCPRAPALHCLRRKTQGKEGAGVLPSAGVPVRMMFPPRA